MTIEELKARASGKKAPADTKKEIWSWVRSIVAALLITLILVSFVFIFVRVDGKSMTYTLEDRDRLFVDRLAYTFSTPHRGDIVILHYPGRGRENFVKRCVAVAGDTVEITGGYLWINGKRMEESYIRCGSGNMRINMRQITVPEGHVFVLGDNRNDSLDSSELGPISMDLIVGKACFIIWPISEWGYIG